MEKSKLGISVGMLAAAAYFMGIVNVLGMVIVVGYILICEENEWLRKSALKAAVIEIGVSLVNVVLGIFFNLGDSFFRTINTLVIKSGGYLNLGWPLNIDGVINTVIYIAEVAILLYLGICAMKQKDVKVPLVDKIAE